MHYNPLTKLLSIFKLTFIFFGIIGLTACSTVHPPSETSAKVVSSKSGESTKSWQAHHEQLTQITHWTLQGSISIQHQQKTDIASLSWTQQQDQYQIGLYGPLSLGRITITGHANSVTLAQTNKKTVSAHTPEQLMQQQLGWQLPISNFYYWVRGIPAPTGSYHLEKDSQHQALYLSQQGWNIHYIDYSLIRGIALPRKIELSNPQLKIKIVIRSWAI